MTDYDQIDNDYKDTPAEKKRKEEMKQEAERQQEMEEKQEYYRKRRQEAIERQDAMREQRDIDRKKQEEEEKQELYRKKRQEAKERQDALREERNERNRAERKTRKKETENKIHAATYKYTPQNPKFKNKEEIEKASYEASENRRMWREIEDMGNKRGTEPPERFKKSEQPAMMPSFGKMLGSRILDTGRSIGSGIMSDVKTHTKNSWSDITRPYSAKPNKRSQSPPSALNYGLGSLGKSSKGIGTGLLSTSTFTPRDSFLFPSPVTRKTTTKKKTRKPRPRTNRNFLDDLLRF